MVRTILIAVAAFGFVALASAIYRGALVVTGRRVTLRETLHQH
jgi:hypothetical protein